MEAGELARKNLHRGQARMKVWYDQKARERTFDVGDKVLVLLPIAGNPLQAKYHGPYTVERRVNNVDYVVSTPDRRKQRQLCHINMLKEYHMREEDSADHPAIPVALVMVTDGNSSPNDTEDMVDLSDDCGVRLNNSQILSNLKAKLGHLTQSQSAELEATIQGNLKLFPDVPSRTNAVYHDVDVGEAEPVKQPPYRVNPQKQKLLQQEVEYMLKNDLIERSHSAWSSPCILVPKPDKTYRFCTDFRKVNSLTKADSYPLPRIKDCIDRIGHSKYVSKFDMLKGYWQVPLSERAKEISAFVTPDGLYQYKVMPFGIRNVPATFQRLINQVTTEVSGCEAYIDDVIIYSDNWSNHVEQINVFFDKLKEMNLTINLAKCEFGCAQVSFLGHIVGQGEVKPIAAKIEAISQFPVPKNKKELMRFLGMAGYYRRFCKNFSTIVEPLTNLLHKHQEFRWSVESDTAFQQVKGMLSHHPILVAPDFTKPFKLAVDASDIGAGAVLIQDDDQGIDHPVCYFSKKFNNAQKRYCTTEKELLALILALQYFDIYIAAAGGPITVFTDHNPLTFLHKLKNKNQRLMRWSLFLQQYCLDIRHIRGRDNIIADALSRSG